MDKLKPIRFILETFVFYDSFLGILRLKFVILYDKKEPYFQFFTV